MSEKTSNVSAIEKAIYLYDLLLFSAKKYSSAELMEMMQCSKSTISRLLQQIENCRGLELKRDSADGREWYSLAAPARRPRLVCSQEEFDELQACIDRADDQVSAEQRERCTTLINRLRLLFVEKSDVISTATEPPIKDWIDYTDKTDILASALTALKSRKVATIIYQKDKQPPMKWNVAPTNIYTADDTIYLSGWLIPDSIEDNKVTPVAFDDEDPQTCFVCLHHVTDFIVTEREHTLPRPEPKTRYFGIMTGTPFRVKVHFEPHVADYVQDRFFGSDQLLISYSDGSLDLEFTACNRDEVVSWLLSFGASAKLVEPSTLVSRFKEELASTLARYRGIVVYTPRQEN